MKKMVKWQDWRAVIDYDAFVETYIQSKYLIYLDQNIWIRLQKHADDSTSSYRKMLAILRNGRRQDRFLCPLGLPTFLELCKAQVSNERRQIASIMEELSEKVILRHIGPDDSWEVSLAILGSTKPNRDEAFCPLVELAGGTATVDPDGDTESQQNTALVELQATFAVPLLQVVDHFADWRSMSETVAKDVQAWQEYLTGLRQTVRGDYTQLLATLIRLHREQCLERFARDPDVMVFLPYCRDDIQNTPDNWTRLLDRSPATYNRLKLLAAYAAKKAKYERGTTMDFLHAAPAVAYCDMFVTEDRRLRRYCHDARLAGAVVCGVEEAAGKLSKMLD